MRAMLAIVVLAGPAVSCGAERAPAAPGSSGGAFTPTADEWFALRARCLEEAGWDVQQEPGSRALEVRGLRDEQQEEFRRTLDGCEALAGPRPPADSPPETELLAFYTALLETRECLLQQGYEIGEPPPADRFVASQGHTPWHPYRDLPGVPEQEWERLNEVCPQPGD